MVHASTRRRVRRAGGLGLGLGLAAALLAACGGEIVALLTVVTPLAGLWVNGATESLQILTPARDVQMYQSRYAVTATVSSAVGVCGDNAALGVAVVGTIDNGRIALRLAGAPAGSTPCLQGTFTDLRRLLVEADGVRPQRAYLNSRVDVALSEGRWVSESGTLALKFEQPDSVDNDAAATVTGCDVSVAVAPVGFIGTMNGFNTASGAVPTVPDLRNALNNALMFSQVEFVDGDTLKLRNLGGQAVTLQRRTDPANTLCP